MNPQISQYQVRQWWHPKYWTPLTWVALLVWGWTGGAPNYPPVPAVFYTLDAQTNQLVESDRYEHLADYPLPVGWPIHYFKPAEFDANAASPGLPVAAGAPIVTPIPVTAPEIYSWVVVVNFLLILVTLVALVYVLQKTCRQFSLRFLFGLSLAVPVYLGLQRMVGMVFGYDALTWFSSVVYFSPIVVAVAVRYSLLAAIKARFAHLDGYFEARQATDYTDAEHAMEDASKLESRGEWIGAIELYELVAKRWPQHAEYTQQCTRQVREKQQMATD